MDSRRPGSVQSLDDFGLSDREREIFWLVAERLRNREIAERLHIGLRTVESHVSTILRKVGAEQRDEIVALGSRLAVRRITGVAPPAPVSSFVGRDDEVADLGELVARERLVTLVGPPGVGKTRLAFHVARTVVGMPPPILVDLSATPSDEDLLRTFGAAVGVADGDAVLRPSLHDALRAQPVWLVVDNCEHVESGAAALVAELLGVSEELRVLATSRSPLGIDGERVVPLQPLAVPLADSPLDDVLDAPACRLFLDRAHGSVDPALTDDQARQVADLCRRLDGLPLALELAAAQTRWFTAGELLEQLDERLLGLDTRRPGVRDRHRTVAAAVQWSYDLLDADERTLLERCSVFPGPFDLDVLVDVAAFGVLDAPTVVRLLPRLVDRSLVSARAGPRETTSYQLLDSIRAFARARVGDAEVREEVEARHARSHLTRAVAVSGELTSRRQASALSWFDRRWGDLVAAMRWTIARGDVLGAWMFIAGVGRRWLVVGGPRGQVLDWIEQLLDDVLPDGRLGIEARTTAAHLLAFQDVHRALPLVEDARRQLAGDDEILAASVDLTEGKVLAFLGRSAEAVPRLERAAAAFRAHGDPWHEALALQALGHADADAPVDRAIASYRRSARRFRELGDDVMLANTLTLMVIRVSMVDHGDVAEVDEWLVESRALAERTGSPWELAHVALNESLLRADVGTQDAFEGLVLAFRQMGDRRCAARALVGLGGALIDAGRDEAAVPHLRMAAELAERTTFPITVAAAVRRLADIDTRAGDLQGAARLLGRADAAASRLDAARRAALPDVDDVRSCLEERLGPRFADLAREGREATPLFPW